MTPYVTNSSMTSPGPYAVQFRELEPGVSSAVAGVQGLLVHDAYLEAYGLSEADFDTVSRATLAVEDRLRTALGADDCLFSMPRALEDRQVGTCRDYALLTVSVLRSQGVPARVRCGFATYFAPDLYEDHWVCEYWKQDAGGWVLVDAQLDEPHREHLGIQFDPTDVPRDRFLTAAEAWRHCRLHGGDDRQFGHGSTRGLWFIGVNVVRDRLALTDQVTSSWDSWREADRSVLPELRRYIAYWDELADDVVQRHSELVKFDSPNLLTPFWSV